MPNFNYIKGRNKEYKCCNRLRKEGFDIVQRTAGSHSPIDIIAINTTTKQILFIQCKPDNISELDKNRLQLQMKELNNMFRCEFVLM